MIEAPAAATTAVSRRRAGLLAATVIFALYAGFALFVNVPATGGFKGDEATYYMMGHSLVSDGDLAYRREDLERTWKEYPSGPAGVFLKRGQHPTGVHLTASPPFVAIDGRPDGDQGRLFYGKSFIYPALAAPFVWLFGTNGFLFFNALLLTAAFLAAYAFVSARSGVVAGLLLAGGFLFASVVPVYFAWIAPELFNFSLGLLAYFFWLHKLSDAPGVPANRWVHGPRSDLVAAGLFGVLTFSKVTNVLLLLPMLVWLAWRREWRQAVLTTAVFAALTLALFGINTTVTGDWNYQGGTRSTFYINDGFPFQTPDMTFDVGDPRGRNEGRGDAILDPDVFWSNLSANLVYVVVGRYSGLVAYFFPALVAILALVAAPRRRPVWQWLVLASVVTQILIFVVSQPYTYFGSGGSVGNRYFIGTYGLCVFLLPAMASTRTAMVMWVVGSLFVARLVMDPFDASVRPWVAPETGPFRWLPAEMTNINDLPLMVNRDQRLFEYGANAESEPMFQLYYLDGNAYLREKDRSFWVRGESRAEVLIKTDRPLRRLTITLLAGPVAATGHVRFRRTSHPFSLAAGASQQLVLELGPGFPYKKDRPDPAYIWNLSITAGPGFVPRLFDPASPDVRYLGVNVKPVITQ